MLRLSENIESIFSENQSRRIKKIISDFEDMKLQSFCEKYESELYLQNCEWFTKLDDIEDRINIYKPFPEKYKKDCLDLLVCWIIYLWNLGFMIEGSELQDSYTIIEIINELLYKTSEDDFVVDDRFGQEILLKSIIQDANVQLEKRGKKFVEFYIKQQIDTHYFFLFDSELADKLISEYNNELFIFNEVTTNNYICSFYFDTKLKKMNSNFKYKQKIKEEISNQIKYLLNQGIKNFLTTLFYDIDLVVLEVFNEVSEIYGKADLKCYVLNNYENESLKDLLDEYDCVKLEDDSDITIERCIVDIQKKSSYITYFGFMQGYGVVQKNILNM